MQLHFFRLTLPANCQALDRVGVVACGACRLRPHSILDVACPGYWARPLLVAFVFYFRVSRGRALGADEYAPIRSGGGSVFFRVTGYYLFISSLIDAF